MKLENILKRVPDYKEFLTVDELNYSSKVLAEKHKDLVELVEIGQSAEGEKIPMLKIGNGEHTALLFGFPHPDEPIGSMTLEFLSQMLVKNDKLRNELDFTWLIVKCIDPDGVRLNEGWFKGSFSILKCALNYYRPAGYDQVEWNFPIDHKTLHFHKPIPETKALMNVINQYKPEFMYSLHNAGFCGVYFYVSHDWKKVYSTFRKIVKKQKLPLHLGEPEAPFMEKFDKAIFKFPSITEIYDYYEKHGDRDPAEIIKSGTSSNDYLKSVCNGFGLVCEMPFYYDSVINDNTLTKIKRRKAVLKKLEEKESTYNFLNPVFEKLKNDANTNTKLFRSIEDYINRIPKALIADKEHAKTSKMYEGYATKAQLFDSLVAPKDTHICTFGKFLRVIKESYKSTKKPYLKDLEQEIHKKILSINDEIINNSNIQIIPIQNLVRVQLGSALEVVRYIKNKR